MKTLTLVTIIAALTFTLIGVARAGKAGPRNQQDMMKVAEGVNKFATDLYLKLAKTKPSKNLFFSPISISTALAMTYAGAKGDTALEMAKVMHYTLPQHLLHRAYGKLMKGLNSRAKTRGNQLVLANALWGGRKYRFLRGYLNLVKTNHGGGLRRVDFATNPEGARKEINRWVEKVTRRKIKNLLRPGMIKRLTRLVLTNAIYFKGSWASKFAKRATRNRPFTLASGRTKNVPMMNQTAKFRYTENRVSQVLEMAYKGKKLSMVVVVPRRGMKLAAVEKILTAAWIERQVAKMYPTKVNVFLPRFETSLPLSLKETLRAMGMKLAFNRWKADFTGMTGKIPFARQLYIARVEHKAFVKVNEEGTEAAAATAVIMSMRGRSRPIVKLFKADRPFLFLIRDNKTGAILFMGRLHDPSK